MKGVIFSTECRRKLEAEKQLLLDEAERVRQERLRLREEQHAMLEETRRKLREEQEKFQRDRYYICRSLRKPVFGVSNQVWHKQECVMTENG